MELTFSIILDKRRQKKNLTYPLKLQIYQDRRYKVLSLGIDLLESDWNDQLQEVLSTNSSYKLHNTMLASIKAKIQKVLLLHEDEEARLTPTDIIAVLNKKAGKKEQLEKPDIFTYGKNQIATLEKAGHIGNSIVYSCAINKLKEYTGREKLAFDEVDYSFLQAYDTKLLADGMKVNGVSNYMRTLRAIFNKAIREELIPENCYPFRKFKIKNEQTINRSLTIAEIVNIANLDLPPYSKIWHHRNLFMLSYCLIGTNFADLLTLKPENLVDGRVVFRRKKTHKVYSILIQPQAQNLFNLYTQGRSIGKNEFLLPFVVNKNNPIELKKDIVQAIKNTNEYLEKMAKLCEINKTITTYYARYSWANAARSLGYSKDLIAEALGHEYGNKVTGIYLDNYSNAIIDEMNTKVIQRSFCQPVQIQ